MTSQAHYRLLEREDSSPFAEGDADGIAPLRLRTAFSLSHGRGLLGEPPSPPNIAPMADKAWAVAFTANVAITLLTETYFSPSVWTILGEILEENFCWEYEPRSRDWALMTCALLVVVACAVPGVLLLACRYLTALKISLGGFVFIFTVAMLLLPESVTWSNAWVIAIMGLALFSCFIRLLPERVTFAAELLKVASRAVTSTPKRLCWALCMTVIRYMWVAVGILAYVGPISAFTTDTSNDAIRETFDYTGAALLYFWMASVSWGSSVAANIVAATVTGSVASRWSSPDNTEAVLKPFHRVMRSSLGSLCKVAAIDCLFTPLQILVASFPNAPWRAHFLMIGLRFTVSYALLHPVVFVSVYRLNFAEAVRHARAMVRAHGRTLLMSDSMMAAGFVYLGLAIAATPFFALAYHYCQQNLFSFDPLYGGVPGMVFVCTVAVTCATLELVVYASKAVFVCLVQVPEAEWTERHDRSPHNDLYQAWRDLQLRHPATREDNGAVQA